MGKKPSIFAIRKLLIILSILISSISTSNAGTPPFWKDTGYIYAANQTPIRKILEDYANQFGVILDIHPSIKGTVNGRIASNSAIEFLDRLALMRKFRWFVYSNTLYVVPMNDNVVEKIKTSSESASESKQAIIGIGLFEPRFGWGELPEEQSIIVSGPSQYVSLIKKVLGQADVKKNDSEIMIFKLKYANADDREIQYRNRIIITPGVATILRNLLQDKRAKGSNIDLAETARNTYGGFNGNAMSTGGLSPNPMLGNTSTSRANNGGNNNVPQSPFSFLGGGNGGEANASLDEGLANPTNQSYLSGFNSTGNSAQKNSKNRVPLVEADARLNAVIIRDDPSKKEYYQALINEFDQQPKMVEIEAMIIDINRSKMKELGIDWTAKVGKTTAGFSAVKTPTLSTAANALSGGSSILINNLNNFYGSIRALEQDGEAYILAKPSVITVDNLGAVLDLNRTAYISLVGERVADVMPVTAGTMLKVTPRTIMEGGVQRIHLVVDIEDGELQEREGSSTPSVQRSTISTQAIIEENQALVIGGYQSQTDNNTKYKIPVLGDIPLIGGLFRSNQKTSSTKERIFVIVPRAMAKQYKRTYGNNVEGTPLPPAITPFIPLPASANGRGQVFYNNQQPAAPIPIIAVPNQSSTNKAISNPFSQSGTLAPPAPTKQNIVQSINRLNSNRAIPPAASINTNINRAASQPIKNVSLLNTTPANIRPNTNINGLQLTSQLSNVPVTKAAATNSEQNKYLNER